MKHYQSKYQSPLLRSAVGFLAGLAAWTQVFSEAKAASVLEAAGSKNLNFVQAVPTFQAIYLNCGSIHIHSEMQTSHCEVQRLCWSLLKPGSSSQAWAQVCLSQQGWDRAAS